MSYRSKFILVILILGVAMAAVVFWPAKAKTRVMVGGVRFEVEVAQTPGTREKGLSGRTGLVDGQGMLFVFDKPDRYMFWMKDMLFPIDIIYIRGGRIVDMALDLP